MTWISDDLHQCTRCKWFRKRDQCFCRFNLPPPVYLTSHNRSNVVGPALMSAAIFGNVSSIMLRMYRGTEEYHDRCHSIREFIRFYRVPSDLASRLLDAPTDRKCRANANDMLSVGSVAYPLVINLCMSSLVTLAWSVVGLSCRLHTHTHRHR